MGNIDLHVHSSYSDDGEFSVETLVRMAEDKKMEVVAIADHDSVKACLELKKFRDSSSVQWIDAIEISTRHNGRDYHLLGYGIDPDDRRFWKLEETVRFNENAATAMRIERLNFYLSTNLIQSELELFAQGKVVTGELICEWLLKDPKNRENPLIAPFFPGGKRSENPLVSFYWDMLAQDRPAYVGVDTFNMADAVKLIHETGGVAVLAHPGNNVKEDRTILNDIKKIGIDGIEAYSSYHSEIQNAYYVEYAKKNGLMITCGSDFHGKTKPKISIGATHCPLTASQIMSQWTERKRPQE